MTSNDDTNALSTLVAKYALAGFERIDQAVAAGATSLIAVCRGERRYFNSLDAARTHLESVR